MTTACEPPSPRYSEPSDYPSVVADELTKALKNDPVFNGQPFRVLRAWNWRWGRYGAGIQVEGVSNQAQQTAVLAHLRIIKAKLNTGRFISVESINVLRDGQNQSKTIDKTIL